MSLLAGFQMIMTCRSGGVPCRSPKRSGRLVSLGALRGGSAGHFDADVGVGGLGEAGAVPGSAAAVIRLPGRAYDGVCARVLARLCSIRSCRCSMFVVVMSTKSRPTITSSTRA
jgi:hypothetical protein